MPAARSIFIAGNWKMNKTLSEARAAALAVAKGLGSGREPQVGLFPSAVALSAVSEAVKGAAHPVIVGAQNIHWEASGAFTGEISAEMVLSAGGAAVILGHSERRHVFGESDEAVGRKMGHALQAGLLPILCVGETLEEREAGSTTEVVARQLARGIERVRDAASLAGIVVAYEPVWAIGTGRTATPAQGQEVHRFLRERLRAAFRTRGGSGAEADATRILYGGSVKPGNAGELLAEEDIDGLLVGGASLEADSFLAICRAAL
jgi:triosephosphate isomerase